MTRGNYWRCIVMLGLAAAWGHVHAQVAPQNQTAKTVDKPRHILVEGLPTPALKRLVINALRQGLRGTDSTFQQPLNQALAQLRSQGYAAATIAHASQSGDTLHIAFACGAYYYLEALTITRLLPPELEEAGLPPPKPHKRQPFSWQQMEAGMVSILRRYENQGRPFAVFGLPQVDYQPAGRGVAAQDTIGVRLEYDFDPGPLVTIDSLVPVGNIREKPGFVQSIVKLKPGDDYDQSGIDAIPQLLNNTPYYQDAKKPVVRFAEQAGKTTAVIQVPVAHKRSNRFDLAIGFLPPQGNNTQFRFTGLLDLQLVSALRLGEILNLKYEELPATSNSSNARNSRRIDVRVLLPNLFGTAFRGELKFDLQQQDTSWLTRNVEPILYYAFTPRLSAKAYYRNRFSSLLSVSPQLRTLKWPPPPILDARSDAIGVGIVFDNVDYKPNPRRGILLTADFGWGGKTIQRTPGLDSLDYNRLAVNQTRTEARVEVAWYRQVRPRQVLVLANRSYWLGLNEYLQNDLAFAGGARSLRGFNENAFLASLYAISTIEYRLLLEQNSYIGLFADYGYLERRELVVRGVQHPLGVGFTLQVQTGAGIVVVSYAVGQSEQVPFQPAQGRIHIGFVATF